MIDNMCTTDVALLKMPNHNMDYPHLAIPTLTSVLRTHSYSVKQQDVNLHLRNYLLTSELMEELSHDFLPQLARAHLNEPAVFERLRSVIAYLLYIENTSGFQNVELVKTLMQARRYDSVFCDDQNSHIARMIFVLTGMLHFVIDLSITCGDVDSSITNPILRYLSQKAVEIAALSPRIVGFSILQIQRTATLWFAKRLKQLINGHIVVGGPDVSLFKEQYLIGNDFIDYAFIKESEESLLALLRGVPCTEIDGIVYRDNDGEIVIKEPKHDIRMSAFRPDFDGYDLDKYLLPTIPLSTSRGCAFAKCKFCNHHETYSAYYYNSAVDTVDNIEFLMTRYKSKFFHFVDDMLEVTRGMAIAEEVIKRNLNISVLTYARFEPQFQEKAVFTLWRKAGIRVIEWGLESASQKVLKKMRKGISIRQVQKTLDASAESGIINKLLLFHNYPGETEEDVRMTVEFLRRNIVQKKARAFFTIRGRLELRLFTPLEVESRGDDPSPFRKRYERSSAFESLLGYADENDYPQKEACIEEFINEMAAYINEHRVFSTNDENMSLDLLILDLQERGLRPAISVQ